MGGELARPEAEPRAGPTFSFWAQRMPVIPVTVLKHSHRQKCLCYRNESVGPLSLESLVGDSYRGFSEHQIGERRLVDANV